MSITVHYILQKSVQSFLFKEIYFHFRRIHLIPASLLGLKHGWLCFLLSIKYPNICPTYGDLTLSHLIVTNVYSLFSIIIFYITLHYLLKRVFFIKKTVFKYFFLLYYAGFSVPLFSSDKLLILTYQFWGLLSAF